MHSHVEGDVSFGPHRRQPQRLRRQVVACHPRPLPGADEEIVHAVAGQQGLAGGQRRRRREEGGHLAFHRLCLDRLEGVAVEDALAGPGGDEEPRLRRSQDEGGPKGVLGQPIEGGPFPPAQEE
ncbi:MAG: hypothetical protein D6759_16285, partial [Chloroflexi bacterium]